MASVRNDAQLWHSGTEFNAHVTEFHQDCCKEPEMSAAKQRLKFYLDRIHTYLKLKSQLFIKFDYTGSSYQRIKVGEDLEFDILLQLDGSGLEAIPLEDHPSQYILLLENQNQRLKFSPLVHDVCKDTISLISSHRIIRLFQSLFQNMVNQDDEVRENVCFRHHGPAIQMDIMKPQNYRHLWFSVDLVPHITLPNGNCYVAKRYKVTDTVSKYDPLACHIWYSSFSLDEKNIFSALDRGNLCRKQAMRILKVICNSETTLKVITSYHLKTIMFHELDVTDPSQWSNNHLGVRVMDLLGNLQDAVQAGALKHYFVPEENLLQHKEIKNATLLNIFNRIRSLRTNQQEMLRLFMTIRRLKQLPSVKYESFMIEESVTWKSCHCNPINLDNNYTMDEFPVTSPIFDNAQINAVESPDRRSSCLGVVIALIGVLGALLATLYHYMAK